MAKIDRLGWAAGQAATCYGLRIGVRVNVPDLLPRLLDCVPPDWRSGGSLSVPRLYSVFVPPVSKGRLRHFHLVYANAIPIARTPDSESAFDAFESDLRLYVAEKALKRVFIHAGVVGWRDHAILVPGRSMSGKSTLVEALVNAGATYYSDEYALLDARGRVHGFPAPLSIRARDGVAARLVPADEVGSGPGSRPLPVGLVVATSYRPGVQWRPRQLSPGEGLLALFAHAVPARVRPVEALAVLQAVVSSAMVLQGSRGEARAVAPRILARLDGALSGELSLERDQP